MDHRKLYVYAAVGEYEGGVGSTLGVFSTGFGLCLLGGLLNPPWLETVLRLIFGQ